MANIIKLLNILKWNTDELHPLTQEKLRELSLEANECMGYKSTFKRLLLSIAETLNEDKNEDKWQIVFPGYKLHKSNSKHYYTGPIFYRHEITNAELHFIIKQIHGISFEDKAKLVLKLIRNIGSKYYTNSKNIFLESIDYDNLESADYTNPDTIKHLNEIIQTTEFPTSLSENLYSNLNIIEDAIIRKKLLSFTPSIIDKDGAAQPCKDRDYLFSPYRIIFYKGYYWLIGNRRLKDLYEKDGWKYNRYSDTLDIYRIDKLLNLSIAQNCYELRAKTTFLTNPVFGQQLDLLCSKIHVYKDNTQIKGTSITNEYGFIEFEILWNNFSKSSVNDYSFIFDTFGHNFSIRQDNHKTIAGIYAYEDCFIDWALMNIDKIKILDTSPNSTLIKSTLKDILSKGLINL